MNIPSVDSIRELRDDIRVGIKAIKAADYGDSTYGQENEYSAKGLIAGVEAIMIDISALIKKPSNLVKTTTATERIDLVALLKSLKNHILQNNLAQIAVNIDKLKPIIRSFNVRFSDERIQEFNDYIDDLQKKALTITNIIETLNDTKGKSDATLSDIESTYENISSKITEFTAKSDELTELIAATEEARESLADMLEEDKKKSGDIEELLTESKSHAELINNFSKRVTTRETQLDKQQSLTDEYDLRLGDYKKQQSEILDEAKDLIASAKKALEYKTAEGLSAAFTEKYIHAHNDKTTSYWIVGASIFTLIAVSIGIWLVSDKQISMEVVVARISLIPILIAGAWFCAGQYIKQKNIVEDYAYKSVLSKSLVGFSEQLTSDRDRGEEYTHYIKSVLSEIHKDPLRKHASKPDNTLNAKDVKEILNDVAVLRKSLDKLLGQGGS